MRYFIPVSFNPSLHKNPLVRVLFFVDDRQGVFCLIARPLHQRHDEGYLSGQCTGVAGGQEAAEEVG